METAFYAHLRGRCLNLSGADSALYTLASLASLRLDGSAEIST